MVREYWSDCKDEMVEDMERIYERYQNFSIYEDMQSIYKRTYSLYKDDFHSEDKGTHGSMKHCLSLKYSPSFIGFQPFWEVQ